jgi:hypothetical protein
MIAPEESLPSDPVAAAAADEPRPLSRGSEDFYLPPHVVAAASSSAPAQNLTSPADGLTVTKASSSIVAESDRSLDVSAATADILLSTAIPKSSQVNAMHEIFLSAPVPAAASASSVHDSSLQSRAAIPALADAPELDDEPPRQAAPLIIDTVIVSAGPTSPPPKSTPSPSPNSRSRGLVPPLAASAQILTSLLEQHREIDSTSSIPSSTLPSSSSALESLHRRDASAAHTADRNQQQLRRGRLSGLYDERSAALSGGGAGNSLLLPATDRSAENDSDQDDSDDDLSSIVTSTTCTASRAPTARSAVDSDVGVFDQHHRHHHQNLHSLSPPSSMLRSSDANAPPSLQAAARFLADVGNGSGASGTDVGDDTTAVRRAGNHIFDFGRPPANLAPSRGTANGMKSPSASATAASAHQASTQATTMAAHATAVRTAESVKREITELHRQWHDEDCEAAEEEPYYFQSDAGLHRRPHQHQHQGAHDGGAGSLHEYHAIQLDLQSALRQVHMMRLDQRLLHARLDEMEALRNAALEHVRELVAAIPALSSSSLPSASASASAGAGAASSSSAAAAAALAATAGLRTAGASSKAPFSASPNGASVSAAALRRRLESESTVLSKSIAATRARLRAVDADRVRARQAVGALEAERAKLLIGCRRAEEGERARKEAQRTAHRLAEALRECKQQLGASA